MKRGGGGKSGALLDLAGKEAPRIIRGASMGGICAGRVGAGRLAPALKEKGFDKGEYGNMPWGPSAVTLPFSAAPSKTSA